MISAKWGGEGLRVFLASGMLRKDGLIEGFLFFPGLEVVVFSGV